MLRPHLLYMFRFVSKSFLALVSDSRSDNLLLKPLCVSALQVSRSYEWSSHHVFSGGFLRIFEPQDAEFDESADFR